ncbi:diguanylate cyclase domain-containing protein [Pontiella sp.]|uniref:diguanylate cyclase domain-containing protein n=1 Tax=Pontiella sp. TaxID=2837462 RepID=UPI0035633EFA
MTSILGVAVAIAFSFITITLIASYYRFQNIVQQAEETNPDEMGASASDVLRVQLARYLAGCARRGTSFSIALIRQQKQEAAVRMDSPIVTSIKQAARRDDVVCLYDDQTAVLLLESEPEDGVNILTRITDTLGPLFEGGCVGIASYPGHGLSGKDLMAVAQDALDRTSPEEPIVLPEIEDLDEDEDVEEPEAVAEEQEEAAESEEPQDEEGSRGWREKRKNSMLDELTGVLKPSAISAYMQRQMSEIRRKKEPAALFCIGVNNMEHIARFHGDDAADDVMAGVSQVLQDNLRADDLIGRHEKYAYLVLAECSLDEAEIIGKRITTLVQQAQFESEQKKLKTTITLGVATFPEHGRNLHQLYLAGQRVLDHSRANDIRAYAVYDPEIHDKMPTKPMKSIKSIQA